MVFKDNPTRKDQLFHFGKALYIEKIMRILILLLIHLSLCVGTIKSWAQVQDSLIVKPKEILYDKSIDLKVPHFNEQTLSKFKTNKAFDYSEAADNPNWWTSFKKWLWEIWIGFWKWLVGDYQANGFVAFLVHVLPYLIITGILIFIIWLFYKFNPGITLFGQKAKPEVFFSEEEEIIRSKNISELMENALANNNFRMAIRYYYLLILQQLTESSLIDYQFDKTNSEYFTEIKSEKIKSGFLKTTDLYDHVWYGNFEVTETDFLKARPVFNSLREQIVKVSG